MPTALQIGPLDHGRTMTLEEFQDAEVVEGYQVELGRGVLVVSEVPLVWHMKIIGRIRKLLLAYELARSGRINEVASGSECKLPISSFDSERHPDLAVYLTEPPFEDSNAVWAEWIPEIVIEVVSPGSIDRDYSEKREEYLAFGVREYWIVDADRKEILALRRVGGRWAERTLTVDDEYAPNLLPGFRLSVAAVFEGIQPL